MRPSFHSPPSGLLALFVFLAFFPAASPPKLTTITFKTDDTSYTITFDDAKISESTIRELIPLSPNVGTYANIPMTHNLTMTLSETPGSRDKTLIAQSIELCLKEDPSYVDCDNNVISSPHFLSNAAVNLEKDRKGLAWLQNLVHPKALQPVIDYLLKQLSLSVWMEDARFRYYSKWDVAVLKQKPAGLDAAPPCPAVFKELNEAKTKEEKYALVWHDWQNCVLDAARNKFGTYPLNSWKTFLQNYGIDEKYIEEGPPD